MLNEDYRDILQILLKNKVKFLVVGAYAMGAHGYPRATGDFDLWVEASFENSKHILNSLIQFGAPLKGINAETFSEEGLVFQIGVPPRRIDIITKIDGVRFHEAFQPTGREKDKLDVKYLKKQKGEK